MQMFNATGEVDKRDAFQPVDVMEALHPFHPAVGQSEAGNADALISVPGETMAQAAATAIAVVEAAFGAPALRVEILTEKEFDRRQGWEHIPELVS